MVRRWVERIDRIHALWYPNRWGHAVWVRALARGVSWWGDWAPTVAVWLLLVVHRPFRAVPFAVAAAVGFALHKGLKRLGRRQRPCERHEHIIAWATPPDRYSFPSGHSMGALLLAAGVLAVLPHITLGWAVSAIVWVMVSALARVVLGMHYPSDVLAGIGLGCVLAAPASLFVL